MAPILRLVLLASLACFPLQGKDYGTIGHLHPIEEEDLLLYLKGQVASLGDEEIVSIQSEVQSKYKKAFVRPTPVSGIKVATQSHTHYFDPAVCLRNDITNEKGQVIIAKGTSYNPLSHLRLPEELLFFDGDDLKQVAWAKSCTPDAKWILVSGSPTELEEKESRPVFFDQMGLLTKNLSIKEVPARVTQEGLKLKIETILLEGACA